MISCFITTISIIIFSTCFVFIFSFFIMKLIMYFELCDKNNKMPTFIDFLSSKRRSSSELNQKRSSR